jgi:hypothetical protein
MSTGTKKLLAVAVLAIIGAGISASIDIDAKQQ